ncbi:MAG: Zn-dependent hydrolase, partial [Cyanobacteria bacterium J06635_13]
MKSVTTAELLVNGDRLNQSIASLASIGQLPNGGVKRIAYSKEDIEARNLVQQWMKDLEMEIAIDAAGNIIGKYRGKNLLASAIATGSHIDTVPCGGHYDGAYGAMALARRFFPRY